MISIYGFCIFMIIVKVSNSFSHNYTAIIASNIDFTDLNNDNDGVSLYVKKYQSSHHKFGLQAMNPRFFFLSIYNPYYHFLPFPYANEYVHFNHEIKQDMFEFYNAKRENMSYSLSATNNDLRFCGINPNYWPNRRPEFYSMNINITNVCAAFNLLDDFRCKDIVHYDMDLASYIHNLSTPSNTSNDETTPTNMNMPKLDVNEIVLYDKVMEHKIYGNQYSIEPKFYHITYYEFETVKTLMSYLPISNGYFTSLDAPALTDQNEIEEYLNKHDETVKYYLYLNKKLYNSMKSTSIKKMSPDRVKNLKSPNLLRYETYNCYVLRMKAMGIIPFHLDFLKKKFGVFNDWKQETLIKELSRE